ncbi:MAG: crossover junction endodeoxyribonuclease RuvC [Alphaproteobacteria bacterium]
MALKTSSTQRIIGLDPGLRHCGWGVIEQSGNHLRFIACGRVNPQIEGEMAERLQDLYLKLTEIFNEYQPDKAAVEQVFQNKNPESTLKLGHARGVVLLSASLRGIRVSEYATRSVKKALVGTGAAEKSQVEAMVRILLPQSNPQDADAADALAVAICDSHHQHIS